MSANYIACRPDPFRQMQRAEQFVEQREVDREININRLTFDAVMPMMKSWRHKEAAHPVKVPMQVGVNEGRMHIQKQQVRLQRALLKAERKHRNGSCCPQNHDLEEVHPRPGHPVHRLS